MSKILTPQEKNRNTDEKAVSTLLVHISLLHVQYRRCFPDQTLKGRFLINPVYVAKGNTDLFYCRISGDSVDDRRHSVFVIAGREL